MPGGKTDRYRRYRRYSRASGSVRERGMVPGRAGGGEEDVHDGYGGGAAVGSEEVVAVAASRVGAVATARAATATA